MNVRFSIVFPFFLLASNVPANESLELDPLIVTASRTARTVDDTLAPVSLFTRADIERLQASSLQEILRAVPGLSISNSGGAGRLTSIFLRGAESDHVLVLVDGVKMGSVTSGMTALQNIPVEQIERIEIVRGPRSSLYGSEAIGGVIQIFTRQGGGDIKTSLSMSGGSYATSSGSLNLSGGGRSAWFNVQLNGLSTHGFNACEGSSALFQGCFTEEPDIDGHQNLGASLRTGYRFGRVAKVDLYWLQTRADTEYDGSIFSGNKSASRQEVLGAQLRMTPDPAVSVNLTMGTSRDESGNDYDGVFVSRFNSRRDTLSMQGDITPAAGHELTVGFDFHQDRIDSTTAYERDQRKNSAVFGQYHSRILGQALQLSLRTDDNEQYGQHTTGSASVGVELPFNTRAVASYGTAFKAPSFNELYYPLYGNPSLKPEQSASSELALTRRVGRGHWALRAYETQVENLIALDAMFLPANIDRARVRGSELVVQQRLFSIDLRASLSLLEPVNRSGVNKDKILVRRAQQIAHVDVSRRFGRVTAGGVVHVEGERFDDAANARVLDAYQTIDLLLELRHNRDWRTQLKLENLLDAKYETVQWYNQAGRSVYVTVRYH